MRPRVRVLIVEDDAGMRKALRRMLAKGDVDIVEAASRHDALAALAAGRFDLIVLDIQLSDDPNDVGGLEVLAALRGRGDQTKVVVVTGTNEPRRVRNATRLGVEDVILKEDKEMLAELRSCVEAAAKDAGAATAPRTSPDPQSPKITGSSSIADRLRRIMKRLAQLDCTVLIQGPTGVGKELLARAIHNMSARSEAPFVVVNCCAVPDALLESELFGHERGAFTGAAQRRIGQLELAGAGTVLLDQVGDMPPGSQVKLLRVLQERTIRRLGGTGSVPVRARLCATTNRDLEQALDQGRFRSDLFFRLNVVSVEVPPLAERKADIPDLVHEHLARTAPNAVLTADAMRSLCERRWPGNVRQLHNCLDRAVALATSRLIDLDDLERGARSLTPTHDEARALARQLVDLRIPLPEFERAALDRALDEAGGNKSKASTLVGLHRKVFARRRSRL